MARSNADNPDGIDRRNGSRRVGSKRYGRFGRSRGRSELDVRVTPGGKECDMSKGLWRALRAGVFCAFLAACAQEDEVAQTEDILAFKAEVSEADLRTARLLSLSNNGALQPISDPYELSISCAVSIQAVADQLRTMNAVTSDQLRAMDAAVRLYRQRALDTGKSRAELNRDIETKAAEEVDVSQQARIGLACLRQLT